MAQKKEVRDAKVILLVTKSQKATLEKEAKLRDISLAQLIREKLFS